MILKSKTTLNGLSGLKSVVGVVTLLLHVHMCFIFVIAYFLFLCRGCVVMSVVGSADYRM